MLPGSGRPIPSRHVRPVLSLLLVLAATLVLIPAIIANWAQTQIYDSDNFASNAVAALEDDAVRAALTREIVDEFIRVGPPDTLAIRPLLEFVTATVVDTQAFVEIYRNAVEQMHRDLFEGADGTGAVALTMVDAIIVVVAFIEQAYPEVAQQLPPNLSTSFIEIRERDWAVRVVTLGEDVEFLAVLLPALIVGLYGCALWIAPDRRRTIVAIGIGCVAVAAMLVIGRDFARDIVVDQVGISDRTVIAVVWDVYTSPLMGWATLVGGFGVLLAVGATRGHERINPRRQFEFVRRAFMYAPETQAGKILRAGLFVVAGFIAINQRTQVLELAVLFAASYLVYYGLSELIWLAGPGTRTTTEPAERTPGRLVLTGRFALRAGSVAALVVAGLAGAFVTYQAVETVGNPSLVQAEVRECNGHEVLCDRRLDEVTFFGTHNSMSAASEPGWFFAEHRTGIPQQLEAGVRAFLIDTWYGYETGRGVRSADRDLIETTLPPDEYSEGVIAAARRLATLIGEVPPGAPRGTYLCHSFCELGATPLVHSLRQIDSWLERNPGEVIILQIQDQITPEDTAKAFIASGLLRYVYHHVDGQPFPTLREMIERNERVVVFAETDASGIDWYLQAFEYIQDTRWRAESPSELSCEFYRGERNSPLFAMNHWISAPVPSQSHAWFVNRFDFMYERALQCQAERGRQVNMIVVNFYEFGDGRQVVDVLNGVVEPPATPTPEPTETPNGTPDPETTPTPTN